MWNEESVINRLEGELERHCWSLFEGKVLAEAEHGRERESVVVCNSIRFINKAYIFHSFDLFMRDQYSVLLIWYQSVDFGKNGS